MMSLAAAAIVASGAGGCSAPPVRTHDNPLLPREFVEGSRWIAPKRKRQYAVMWAGRAVDGRFSVYAGGNNPVTGINEKIMWVVPARATGLASTRMRIEWRRDGESVVQRGAQRAGSPARRQPHPRIYPSILRPPEPGCWKLRLATGKIRSTIYVIVQAPPSKDDEPEGTASGGA